MIRRSSPKCIVSQPEMPSMVELALKLRRRNLPITLCDGKKPLGRGWSATGNGSEWPQHAWTDSDIRRAFALRGDLNLGIVLGPRSGLIDLEADSADEERAFTELFAGCEPDVTPTFKSRRGKHRLFRWHDDLQQTGKGIVNFRGLGIRIGAGSKGAQSLLPPSVNSDGTRREWLVSLDECDTAPLPNVVIKRILEASKSVRADTENTEGASYDLSLSVSSECTASSVSTYRIDEAIAATLPTGEGKRNERLFEYARRLKSIPELAGLPVKALKPLVRRWHAAALPVIRTKPFETTWLEFARGWKVIRFAAGHGPVDEAYAAALKMAAASMPLVALEYEQPKLRFLICLCKELQRPLGTKPFFLASRTAGELLGVTHTTAWEWLKVLAVDEVLREVEIGDRAKRRATTYLYLGD
ncbi:MAG: bifunctional DNA primase/polymerase [Planctomycetia bacterium]|nr:bifunctional DNA primase/polymerase [Planctomycetia bacterium]